MNSGSHTDTPLGSDHKHLSTWLFLCCALVFLIIIVGAVTRLTESGLSIVEWKPVIGTLPPMNEADWRKEFEAYKQSPEYIKKNFWMTVEDFKKIYFWEWFHRLLGRIIGLAYALPFFYLLAKRQIPQGYTLKFLTLVLLVGFQGAMGWYMVKSGLIDQPSVSHYRLAAHLSLALLLYSLSLWTALSLRTNKKTINRQPDKALYYSGWWLLGLIGLTILWGAFTAGLDAGLVYSDTFPKMGETWIPAEVTKGQSLAKALLETHAGVQFLHRWLAILSAMSILLYAFCAISARKRREKAFAALGVMIVLQVALGLSTLFSGVALLPAVLHQAGAIVVLTLLLMILHGLKPQAVPQHG
jgi:cytochrome c oxidase assembly protein subunit 15